MSIIRKNQILRKYDTISIKHVAVKRTPTQNTATKYLETDGLYISSEHCTIGLLCL